MKGEEEGDPRSLGRGEEGNTHPTHEAVLFCHLPPPRGTTSHFFQTSPALERSSGSVSGLALRLDRAEREREKKLTANPLEEEFANLSVTFCCQTAGEECGQEGDL